MEDLGTKKGLVQATTCRSMPLGNLEDSLFWVGLFESLRETDGEESSTTFASKTTFTKFQPETLL